MAEHTMLSEQKSTPEVFIIESLQENNEELGVFEGRLLSEMLRLSGKYCEYLYVRTKLELEWAVARFSKSGLRYLHLSCHGSESSMATTLESLTFPELGAILKPALKERRLFVSACSMMNSDLAEAVLPNSGCYSMIGPAKKIAFGDAALTWASFYNLMFKRNEKAMKRHDILDVVETLSNTFRVTLRYYTGTPRGEGGHLLRHVRPKGNTSVSSGEEEEEFRRPIVRIG